MKFTHVWKIDTSYHGGKNINQFYYVKCNEFLYKDKEMPECFMKREDAEAFIQQYVEPLHDQWLSNLANESKDADVAKWAQSNPDLFLYKTEDCSLYLACHPDVKPEDPRYAYYGKIDRILMQYD